MSRTERRAMYACLLLNAALWPSLFVVATGGAL